MNYFALCVAVFGAAYLLNITYITVFYHRGLTHGAVRMSRATRRFVVATGSWVTGLDPKSWSCMHRLHHLHSDTEQDPHSPQHSGIFPLMMTQLRSYNKVLCRLIRKDKAMMRLASDLDFPVSWLNRHNLWYAPYLLHLAVGLIIGLGFGAWCLGFAYFAGMMSHPIQGWMVNSFGHSHGYQTYATGDQSRNNTIVAWLVMGEGYQNNHHCRPRSAKFSVRWFEVDMGYGLCLILQSLGLITIVDAAEGSTQAEADLDEVRARPLRYARRVNQA